MPNHRRHYQNSPITEAVIDIRAELSAEFRPEFLDSIGVRLNNAYPKRDDLNLFQGQFTIGVGATSTQAKLGYLLRSGDGKYVFQARTNGFTLSRLAPYDKWEPFRDEARRLWEIYKDVAKPIRVIRVASRSINRIDIPFPQVEVSDYLRTYPEISEDLPQFLSGYVMQLLIPQMEFDGMLSLIQATVPAQRPETTSLSLDIDMFKESSSHFESDQNIWTFLEYLRDKKNEVFEGCITDRARELFGTVA
jgi:uncharacterized protein (TIGR04255 family)